MNAKRAVAALFAAALVAPPTLADEPAASGVTVASISLDPAFGTDGVVRAAGALSTHLDVFRFVRVDGEGRIVVAGEVFIGDDPISGAGLWRPGVARFLADGTIDATFGSGGVALAQLRGTTAGLTVDPDGGAVICGLFDSPSNTSSAPDVGAVRFTPQGEIDTAFGPTTLRTTNAYVYRFANIAASPDGSVHYALESREEFDQVNHGYVDLGVVRIGPDGKIHSSFGTGGFAIAAIALTSIAVDRAGRILAAGEDGVVRFGPDGYRDFSVSSGGYWGLGLRADALSIDAQDRVLIYSAGSDSARSISWFICDGPPESTSQEGGFVRVREAFPRDAVAGRTCLSGGGGRAALAAGLTYNDVSTGARTGTGFYVQAIDLSRPDAVLGYVAPRDTQRLQSLNDVTVTTDGSAALAAGSSTELDGTGPAPFLMRVALAPETPQSVPNLTVSWNGPIKIARHRSRTKLRGRLRIRNDGLAPVENAIAELWLSRDFVVDADDVRLLDVASGPIGPGKSFTSKVRHVAEHNLRTRGFHVIARIDVGQLLPQTSYADDVAVSASIR